ncbi:hypothetical protein Q2T41_00020 [Maribacter confluentis]|uniref:Uncharacterized protein n=1 Tax=Maribacter confluentis TaxID=1656093 RepID=A0ABT8RL63_9FLAO|nr:hypothetical protein [Maribacter confluentis]MDO1511049.1 hypothetical protein [Maribacter confluentis]
MHINKWKFGRFNFFARITNVEIGLYSSNPNSWEYAKLTRIRKTLEISIALRWYIILIIMLVIGYL